MDLFAIGKIRKPHGLGGALKVQMYYPYTDEVLSRFKIFIDEREVTFEQVFGRVNDLCVLKLQGLNSKIDADVYRNEEILALVSRDYFYSFHLIGLKVFRGAAYLGESMDIQWINGVEFLDLKEEMISLNQIKAIEKDSIYV